MGVGTGIVARQFQAAGCQVLGVDPDARLAEFARHSGVEVEVSTFEAWEAAGRKFDAVVSGESWHWVDPVVGASKAAELLRPVVGWLCSGTRASRQLASTKRLRESPMCLLAARSAATCKRTRAVARVGEQPPSSTPTSLPVRTTSTRLAARARRVHPRDDAGVDAARSGRRGSSGAASRGEAPVTREQRSVCSGSQPAAVSKRRRRHATRGDIDQRSSQIRPRRVVAIVKADVDRPDTARAQRHESSSRADATP